MKMDRSEIDRVVKEAIYRELREGKENLDYAAAQDANSRVSEEARFTDVSSEEDFQIRVMDRVVRMLAPRGFVTRVYKPKLADTIGEAVDNVFNKLS